jgi:hypothetical protein
MRTVLAAAAGFALILGLMSVGTAQAQSAKSARSAASLECSKQADDQNLHGKARKKFRKKCLKEARKNA